MLCSIFRLIRQEYMTNQYSQPFSDDRDFSPITISYQLAGCRRVASMSMHCDSNHTKTMNKTHHKYITSVKNMQHMADMLPTDCHGRKNDNTFSSHI